MSHYPCIVVIHHADSLLSAYNQAEEQMAPFDEQLLVDTRRVDITAEEVAEATEAYSLEFHQDAWKGQDSHANPKYRQWVCQALGWWLTDTAPEGSKTLYQFDTESGTYYRTEKYNPQAKWDSFRMGGRFSGKFHIKPGTPSSAYAREFPGSAQFTRPTGGKADIIQVKNINFEQMAELAQLEATMKFDRYAAAVHGLDIPPTFDELVEKHQADVGENAPEAYSLAREEYWSHPWTMAAVTLADHHVDDLVGHWHAQEENPRESFIETARLKSYTSHAMLENGVWDEIGTMGWFGSVTSKVKELEWRRSQSERILNLPGDAWLVLMDAHI